MACFTLFALKENKLLQPGFVVDITQPSFQDDGKEKEICWFQNNRSNSAQNLDQSKGLILENADHFSSHMELSTLQG